MKRFAVAAIGAMFAVSTADAQVLLQDSFTNDNAGATALNYDGFINWTVSGKVDLVNNFGGVACPGPCVDLDGSPGPGSISTRSAFAFNAGDIMRISFAISGNQRSGASDNFYLYLNFFSPTSIGAYAGTGGLSGFSGASLLDDDYEAMTSIGGQTPFSTWTFQFQAASAGSVRYTLGTPSNDNQGPVVDDIVIEKVQMQSVVPEPSTWAMLAFGLVSVGAAARRRSRRQM